ncbi:hypothetical protein [Paenibacillus woosongensis]|uniref:Uncharacterized protein n=1 Tax=Paenibacillus woosongensis TaxID=307580 RepID=A0A7X3CLQ9_9BACL|nr:hypothetical protein [Paenibacillus woosongensis]MUG43437.1 hypothetical protein [Paenibacillus woosongensis]
MNLRQSGRYGQQAWANVMARMERTAPPGIMDLYHALLARGPISTTERGIVSAQQTEKQRFEREVARISAEMDSGEYFVEIAEAKARFKAWIKDIRKG